MDLRSCASSANGCWTQRGLNKAFPKADAEGTPLSCRQVRCSPGLLQSAELAALTPPRQTPQPGLPRPRGTPRSSPPPGSPAEESARSSLMAGDHFDAEARSSPGLLSVAELRELSLTPPPAAARPLPRPLPAAASVQQQQRSSLADGAAAVAAAVPATGTRKTLPAAQAQVPGAAEPPASVRQPLLLQDATHRVANAAAANRAALRSAKKANSQLPLRQAPQQSRIPRPGGSQPTSLKRQAPNPAVAAPRPTDRRPTAQPSTRGPASSRSAAPIATRAAVHARPAAGQAAAATGPTVGARASAARQAAVPAARGGAANSGRPAAAGRAASYIPAPATGRSRAAAKHSLPSPSSSPALTPPAVSRGHWNPPKSRC